MLFNSIQFAIFLPIVLVVFYSLKNEKRYLFLLAASFFFYASWNLPYLSLIIFSAFVDFWCARKIYSSQSAYHKKVFLIISLCSNLGILFTYKYLDFVISSINLGFNTELPLSDLILPMGISFYTFQTMSYTLDIYSGKLAPEHNYLRFCLFVSFFPQLVAGPIERANKLLPQLSKKFHFKSYNFASGGLLILKGLFKKVVIADRLALFVNGVFNDPQSFDASFLIIATIFFAFQIYCDFSGYSDIAIGTARLLGIHLSLNFKRPYSSKSIPEFWRKWHITLSTWFKDYVYIPLGGNRQVKWKSAYNLLITFLVSGIWHGANWTFLLWGGFHGLGLIFHKFSKFRIPYSWVNLLLTFAFVNIGWIIFRAQSLSDAILIFDTIASYEYGNLLDLLYSMKIALIDFYKFNHAISIDFGRVYMQISVADFLIGLIGIEAIILIEKYEKNLNRAFFKSSLLLKILTIYFMVMIISLFGIFNSTQFIYFQF